MQYCLTLLLLISLYAVQSVDRSKFKSCSQSGFCKRCRAVQPGLSQYEVDEATLHTTHTSLDTLVTNQKNGVKFKLSIIGQADNTFRLKINEAYPLKPRFEVPLVLVTEPDPAAITVISRDSDKIVLGLGEASKCILHYKPLRVDFYSGDKLVLSTNARGMMKFEHLRNKNGAAEAGEGGEVLEEAEDEPDMWQESYGGHTDSKPNGPTAMAMDFTFAGFENVYGIPQHADTFSLKDTSSTDPYRLYNLDVFEYELWNPMALYASIPFMMAHNTKNSVGLFWLNAAEGWIDVKKGGQGWFSSGDQQVDTFWMFESGIVDVFVMLGPGPKDISRQYGVLTGTTPTPPEFAIAYHQCRWNYNDQDDVTTVARKFDEYDIPMDVMWLDIEHTDGKKYFTWDGRKFPDSVAMTDNLSAHGRKLVTIVDPHIKKDSGYWVHNDLSSKGLYVKNKDGGDYEGWCWPGASYYPDFLNKEARDYFAEQYRLENYKGSTLDTYTWNDMNEPSVFNGPEVTMAKDKMHGEHEHRDLHNMYGMVYTMATHQGHLIRSDNKLRPFVLTRSAYAGSQRYAAIWTGDNTAEWGHLEASIPMCLSLSVAGMAFCGADIGGFFGNPDGELFVRWYQAAAFQPFFRSHAHIDTKRREPWLYSDGEMSLIRAAIRTRYGLLPLWYTLFYEAEQSGVPPMRPLWYEFPGDETTYTREGSHMVGESLLVAPVLTKGATSVEVLFPGSTLWYDYWTHEKLDVSGVRSIPAPYEKVPVFQRGGTIIPIRERIRRSSALMHQDPITLIVAPDKDGYASGTLYLDDGKSFDYKDGARFYMKFTYKNGKLESKMLLPSGNYNTDVWVYKVMLLGQESKTLSTSGQATLNVSGGSSSQLDTSYSHGDRVLVVRKPGVSLMKEWEISL